MTNNYLCPWCGATFTSASGRGHHRRRCTESPDTSWMERGACLGSDPELWHPERGESVSEAKAICASCPVRVECLEYALDADEKHGIWGGTSERERRRMRRERKAS